MVFFLQISKDEFFRSVLEDILLYVIRDLTDIVSNEDCAISYACSVERTDLMDIRISVKSV